MRLIDCKLGCAVIYIPRQARNDENHSACEQGIIVRDVKPGDVHVMVSYGQINIRATAIRDLLRATSIRNSTQGDQNG